MHIRTNKLGRGTRKHPEDTKGMRRRMGASILSIETAGRARFRQRGAHDTTAKEQGAVEFVFQNLLSEANQELARLVQDVRTGPQNFAYDEARSRQVSAIVERAIRCAEKQYQLQAKLGDLALKDELTGFYNRRGFHALAERQMQLGRRAGRSMLLFFIDVDGLKEINDTFGHNEGDSALRRAAKSLRDTFRESDIIARMGGDEFAILAVEAAGHCEESIRRRLYECLERANAEISRYPLSLSVGVARFDCRKASSIAELMEQADKAMYKEKRERQGPRAAVGIS
jgi:diguanylate cyclase (GGDEF)-like protein